MHQKTHRPFNKYHLIYPSSLLLNSKILPTLSNNQIIISPLYPSPQILVNQYSISDHFSKSKTLQSLQKKTQLVEKMLFFAFLILSLSPLPYPTQILFSLFTPIFTPAPLQILLPGLIVALQIFAVVFVMLVALYACVKVGGRRRKRGKIANANGVNGNIASLTTSTTQIQHQIGASQPSQNSLATTVTLVDGEVEKANGKLDKTKQQKNGSRMARIAFFPSLKGKQPQEKPSKKNVS